MLPLFSALLDLILKSRSGSLDLTIYFIWYIQHFFPSLNTNTDNILQFSTLICVFTLDRIGRRWTLYWGSVGQT